MRNQLELLYKVQTIDTNTNDSEKKQEKFHNEIVNLENKVTNEEDGYEKAQEDLSNLEKEHRESERLLASLEDKKKKVEDKLLSIKTNKEYQASLHEIESINGAVKEKEDEIIGSMDKIDAAKVSVKEAEEALKKTKAQYETEKNRIEEELKSYLDDIKKQKEKRELLVKEIDSDIFADYKMIQKVKHGFAVALAKNEQCMGCSMKIPPQIYNEVVFAKTIKTCPHCNRILFVQYDDKSDGEA